MVNLAPLTDPALVVSTIAQTIGVKEAADRSLLSSLKDYLKTRHMLLLLDNFEQVIDAASDVAQLLAECAHLKILTTTRIALHIRGEQEYVVPPLALPDPEQLPPANKLAEYEAVALFVERARAVNSDFELNDGNAAAIGAICVRLDGLPLAIELAAARVRLLPPKAMLARLEHSLKLLTGGARDLPARQQTLRNAIEWSYDLLDAGEKQLFRRLAVFVGGRTLQAIEEIGNADGDLQVDVLDGVDSLVSKSLMQQREGPQGEPRFWMLETIHEYARETLEESGEAEALRSRHARYFVQLAEQAESQLRGARQADWLDRLEAEHDNFRAVLRWTSETGQVETAARAAGALWRFWHVRGYLSEGRRHLARVLEQPTSLPVALRAKILYGAGRLALVQGDYSAALVLDSQSLTAYREAGDRLGEANLLNELGNVAGLQGNFDSRRGLHEDALRIFRDLNDKPGIGAALFQLANVTALGGDYEKATPLMEESLEMLRLAGDKRGIALSLYSLGNYKRELGDYDDAIARYDECLLISRELGDRWSIANTLRSLGTVACDQGRFEQAGKLLEEGLEIFRKLEARRGVANSLSNLGEVALQLGEYDKSQALLQESLAIRRELGNKPGTVECLESLARLACAREQWTRAATLFGSAAALRESMHAPLTPADNIEQDRLIATARLNTGDAACQEAWERGASASLDDIISLALDQQP